MRSYFIALLFFLLGSTGMLSAQPINWSAIEAPAPTFTARDLYYSENLEVTIFCGLFQNAPGQGYYLAGYNGTSWEQLSNEGSYGFDCATDYQEGVLIGGQQVSDGPGLKPLGYYDGENWTFPWEFTGGSVRKLIWTNDTLFALGTFTEIDGEPVYYIAKLSGETWEPMLLPDEENTPSPILQDIEYFEGHYYVGGNFHSTGEGPDDFGRLENMQVVAVDGGLGGGYTGVGSLQVYQGELIIGGTLPIAEGNVGNHLIKWNGEELMGFDSNFFFNPGVFDIYGSVNDMFIKDGYLICFGNFYYLDDIPMAYAARWDGSQWCGLWGSSFVNNGPSLLFTSGFFQDKFMIARNFTYEDGTSDFFWIFEGGDEVEVCSEPLSVNSEEQLSKLTIYPNPANGKVRVELPDKFIAPIQLRIYDVTGRQVAQYGTFYSGQQLDVSTFSSGMYVVQGQSGNNQFRATLVVE